MTFTRLSRADALAMVAALALLLVMAMTWYTTKQGEIFRQEIHQFVPQLDRQLVPSPSQQAAQAAAAQEKNAWQASAPLDRLLLVTLLVAAGSAIVMAFMRAADRHPSARLRPSSIATGAGLLACALLVYRIINPPGLHVAAVVKPGAPLALLCVGALALGARVAMLREATAVGEGTPAAPREAASTEEGASAPPAGVGAAPSPTPRPLA